MFPDFPGHYRTISYQIWIQDQKITQTEIEIDNFVYEIEMVEPCYFLE
jgi:hypothetical protein